MTLKAELHAYKARWANVEAVIAHERRSASLELRWRQLNSAIAMAQGLRLLRENPTELEVIERWVKLKEKAILLPPKR